MARLTDEELAAMSSLNRRTATSQRNLNDRTYNLRSARTARELRLGREIVEDLASLGPAPKPPTLRKEEPRGGIPAARGYVERNNQAPYGPQTSGIAGPLIEGGVAPDPELEQGPSTPVYDREYYEGGIPSSDGLFMFPALKKITLRDANGSPVAVEFAKQPEEE